MTGLREAIKKLRTRSVSNTTDYNVGFNAGLRVAAAYMEDVLERNEAEKKHIEEARRISEEGGSRRLFPVDLDNLRKDNANLQSNPVFQRGDGTLSPKISYPYRGEMPPFFPYCNDIPVAPEEE